MIKNSIVIQKRNENSKKLFLKFLVILDPFFAPFAIGFCIAMRFFAVFSFYEFVLFLFFTFNKQLIINKYIYLLLEVNNCSTICLLIHIVIRKILFPFFFSRLLHCSIVLLWCVNVLCCAMTSLSMNLL